MASQITGDVFRSWLSSLNDRNWDDAALFLDETITFNERNLTKQEYMSEIQESFKAIPDDNIELDMLIVDTNSPKLAARLIHSGTLSKPYHGVQVTGKRIKWPEHMLCWFKDSKIIRIQTLHDIEIMKEQNPKIPRTPTLQQRPPSEPVNLAENYRAYVNTINTLTMQDHFPKYCQPTLTHNTRKLTIDEYRLFIEGSFENIQGLTFTIKELIVDDASQVLAARLEFGGRSVKEFMGIPPSGEEVRFWEHVFYAFDGGKITWVWAMLDLEAYRGRGSN